MRTAGVREASQNLSLLLDEVRKGREVARIASRRGAAARLRERRALYRAGLPGPLYCDTSALLKLYLPEPGSDTFNEVGRGPG